MTRKPYRIKLNTHKQIKLRSLKNFTIDFLSQGLRIINFPYHEYFDDVDIVCSDFIRHLTSVINKIAAFKEIRIKNYLHDWFDSEILDKIILRDKRLQKFKASRISMNSCIKKQK